MNQYADHQMHESVIDLPVLKEMPAAGTTRRWIAGVLESSCTSERGMGTNVPCHFWV